LVVVRALILWDVDHTLVENAGVSKEIYAAAFASVAGVPPRFRARTEGRTDRLILRDMFEAHGLAVPAWPVVHDALQRAGAERFNAMRERGSVLPGVTEAVETLAIDPNIIQSVLTGNIPENARMKVTAVGLGAAFDFEVGAYGSDGDDRAELVAVAQSRASDRYRESFTVHNTVLIGDTPRDIDAGLRGGAEVIAVATGEHSVDELRAAGARLVLASLIDTDLVTAQVARLIARDRIAP